MGHINFFRPFIGGDGIIFSNLTAPLTSMTHKDFNWSRTSWTQDFEGLFENVKKAMPSTMQLYPPNYAFEWRLQPDASTVAVGAGLYQIAVLPDHTEERQLIGLYNQKDLLDHASCQRVYHQHICSYNVLYLVPSPTSMHG